MYCSACGNQATVKLNYCNICGAKMARTTETEGEVSPLNGLITTLAFVALGGFGILVGLLAMLLSKGATHEAVAMIAGLYLAALFGICFSLIRLMSRMIDPTPKEKAENQNQVFQPVQLPALNTAQLEEMKQRPFSVVENTTRTFEKVPLRKN